RMDFAVPDRGHGRQRHIEAVEPVPAFDKMEAYGAAQNDQAHQRHNQVGAMKYAHGESACDASWGASKKMSSSAIRRAGKFKTEELGSAKGQQRDFRRNAQAHRSAYGTEAAIHVQDRMAVLRIEVREVKACRLGRALPCAIVLRRREQRTLVGTRNVVGDETRRTQAMVEDFDLNLTAVRVPGERKLDSQLRR